MTTENVKTLVKRHKVAAFIGGAVGLLGLGGWVVYVIMMTPSVPVIQSAQASEIVEYISNQRGLAKLSRIEQKRFLEEWRSYVMLDDHRENLKGCFDRLERADRKRFTESISKQLKRSYLDDARHFARLTTPAEKNRFLRKKVVELRKQAFFIQDVAGAFKSDLGGPEEFRQWLMEHTTAKDRTLGEPYTQAIKRVAEQIRKEERASAASLP